MEFIGSVGAALLGAAYTWRVVLVGAGVVLLAALVVLGRRRGWARRAARHPRATLAGLGLALVVGFPLAWYLFSPLLVRTTLVEPPVAAAGPASPATAPGGGATLSPDEGASGATVPPVGATTPAPATATPAPATAPPPGALPTLRGEFQGTDEFHFGRGTAILAETAGGTWTLRFEDFSVRNGPDLYVYLSPDPAGYAEDALDLGRLRATDGSFNVEVPAGADIGRYRSVLIWCRQFRHLFAVATLSRASG